MATKQITTWDEFKTALMETITENTTYEIMNDIDVSDTIIESVIVPANVTYRKTINGNEHSINGITSYLTYYGGIIGGSGSTTSHNITYNDIKFTNIMLQSCGLFHDTGFNKDYHFIFNRCYFSGLCGELFYMASKYTSAYPTINRCSINIKCQYLVRDGGVTMNECYTIIQPFSTMCEIASGRYVWGTISNCYFGGTIKTNYSTDKYIYGYYSGGTNNIFNCEVHILNYSASTTYYPTGGNNTESTTCLYNTDKIYNAQGTSIQLANRTEFIGLTDSQLKSRTYIQENTNFPLYG